jgi:hypothetical protein
MPGAGSARSTTFLDFLLGVSQAQIASCFEIAVALGPPDHLRSHSETRIVGWIQEIFKEGVSARIDPASGHLERSVKTECQLWRVFMLLLKTLKMNDQALCDLRSSPKDDKHAHIEKLVEISNVALRRLSLLITSSPSFWLLLQNQAILDAW